MSNQNLLEQNNDFAYLISLEQQIIWQFIDKYRGTVLAP